MPVDVLLFGAGGHAKVVYSALRLARPDARVIVVDDDPVLFGAVFLDLEIQAPGDWSRFPDAVHVGIGRNETRRAITARLQAQHRQPLPVVHPSALVAARAEIAAGAFVAAGAIIGPEARVGAGAIINHGAVVDHDCRIGAFAHVAPNATLGGGVAIGASALIGAGAIVLPGLVIGDGAVVAAGAVVNRPVGAGQTVMGVPAKAVG